jgi:rubrerythrin
MTLYKKATMPFTAVITSNIYFCDNCGYTETVKNSTDEIKKCPECKAKMTLISSSAESN